MSDSRASASLDRLPWLADEPKPQPRITTRNLGVLAAATVLLVAGLFFWLGRNETVQQPRGSSVAVTTALPRPTSTEQRPMASQPQVSPAPVPEVRPLPAPEVRIMPPPRRTIRHRSAGHAVPAVEPTLEPKQPVVATSPPPASAILPASRSAPLRPWPSRITSGAYGRLVQIGAYGSRLQAKQGWVAMVRSYPAVAHLQAVVVATHNSNRRTFYRFQIGTTSQAHSEVLCQRMQRIKLSCAIIGLPWKSKIER